MLIFQEEEAAEEEQEEEEEEEDEEDMVASLRFKMIYLDIYIQQLKSLVLYAFMPALILENKLLDVRY